MDTKKTFAIVGGDMRQAYLAELLAADGHAVTTYALEKYNFSDAVTKSYNLQELARRVDCVVLPLPVMQEDGILNTPLSQDAYLLEDIFNLFTTGQTVVAGKVSHSLFEKAGRSGVRLFDYLEREEFSVSNAIPSAEGAIGIAMDELAITLREAKCLVVGFGRIGKLLAHYLHGFGSDVTVSARKFGDIAWINAYGYHALNTLSLGGTLSEFDVIINTVPCEVLGGALLRELKHGCLCIDIASKPGGIDFNTAKKLGIKTIWALSLPGKVA
ncbi:MAG: dipicolinate synthase subunit DpsA, partial [Clostridia bacterium]